MECKQCKLRIPKNSRSKVFIGYCRHCAGSIPLPGN
jgi:Zn-finger nucleic acid-binding protein